MVSQHIHPPHLSLIHIYVELSYTFENKAGRFFANKCKLFVRGTNLLTFSKIKDLDPERLNAGITNYPAYMTVTGGLSVSF